MKKQNPDFEKGMKLLTRMNRQNNMKNQKEIYPDLYKISVEHLFGDIWTRPHLSLRDRQLVTLAANIALARPTGNHSHYRSAKFLGVTHEEIMEIIIHVGHYGGWPTIGHAVEQYTQVLEEDAAAKSKKKPAKKSAKKSAAK